MVEHLDAACHQSQDPILTPHLVVATRTSNGRRGRPKVEISPAFLSQALEVRGPTGIAPVLGCSARTVRRRALEQGLAQPGPPVIQDVPQPDGTIIRTHTSTTAAVSPLTDDELDGLVSSILEVFPRIGRSLIKGHLNGSGYHVPVERIAQSFLRVHGAPGIFGGRAIHRKVYSVAGANSLWHHDGQHGAFLRVLSRIFVPTLLNNYAHRAHTLQDRHTRLHRWQVALHHRPSRPQQ